MNENFVARALRVGQQHVVGGTPSPPRILRGHGRIDKLEGEFRRRADARLYLLRLEAGPESTTRFLAVCLALRLDGGLGRARRSTCADDLDSTGDRVRRALYSWPESRHGDEEDFRRLDREVKGLRLLLAPARSDAAMGAPEP